jgi:hypothetical protein
MEIFSAIFDVANRNQNFHSIKHYIMRVVKILSRFEVEVVLPRKRQQHGTAIETTNHCLLTAGSFARLVTRVVVTVKVYIFACVD